MKNLNGKEVIEWFKNQDKYRRILFKKNNNYRIINLDEINVFKIYSIKEHDSISVLATEIKSNKYNKDEIGVNLFNLNKYFQSMDCFNCEFKELCENFIKSKENNSEYTNLCKTIESIYNFYKDKK